MLTLLKHPTAWMPMAMSVAALALVFGHLALYGVGEPQEDEGTAAHLFQFLIGGQLPIIAFFALKWLPQAPKQAAGVLALQFFAALAPLALIFTLEM